MTLQAGLILAAVLALFAGGYYVGNLRGRAQLEALQASQFQALADAYQKQRAVQAAAQAALERENAELTADRLAYPNVDVRVCRIQTANVPAAPATGHGVPAGTGALPQNPARDPDPGADVGPALFDLADQADAIVAKCRAQ